MLPETLKRMAVYADGTSYLGKAEEITLPTIERATEDYRGAGMGGPVKLGVGWGELMMGIKLKEYSASMLKLLSKGAIDGAGLRFVGAFKSDDPGASAVAIEVVARGRLDKLDLGTAKEGDLTDMETEFPLSYFRFDRNGETLVELDYVNGVEVIAGEDVMAELRRIIGLSESG